MTSPDFYVARSRRPIVVSGRWEWIDNGEIVLWVNGDRARKFIADDCESWPPGSRWVGGGLAVPEWSAEDYIARLLNAGLEIGSGE